MQIRKILLLVEILFGCIFISCNNDLDNNKNQEKSKSTGIISGKVLYSNLNESQNAGIIITLDKTDGLRTSAVIKAVKSRSIIPEARSIVANTVTNADGSYTFENIESGTYTIYAASPYSTEKAVYTNVVVREAETTVADVMTLTATGRITGKITLDEGVSGNTGFIVFVAGTSYMAITDDGGNYTISDVPAGNGYQLVVMKNNVMHFLDTDVVVNANSSTSIATNNFTSKELKASDGKDGADGTSIVWLGSFEDESEIENPQYLNAYFNMKDGCSYIYDGTKWTLLSAKGDKGDNGTDGKDEENGSNGTNGKDALAIGAVLSTEELTNQNVIITVNITQADISKIGYVYSSDNQNWNTANSILTNSDFISMQPDSNGKYQVVADKNGYYAFAVKNSDGYSTFTEEYITNIDKTAPGPVSNLIAKYNKNTKVLSVTWTNPTDSDFDYAVLGCTKGGVTVTSNVRITNGTYTLSDVESDGEEFVFTVYAKDKVGNTSKSQTSNVTPVEGPTVQSITLSRYHWAFNDPDQTVTATAVIRNADLIEDGTVVKFQTKDYSGNVTNTVATLNKTLGTATATIKAPIDSSNPFLQEGSYSTYGETFIVFCKINDVLDATHSVRFNVSSNAKIERITQLTNKDSEELSDIKIPLNIAKEEKSEIIRLMGYNLDLANISIQLYDSTGIAYFSKPIKVDTDKFLWNVSEGDNIQTIDTLISYPIIDGCYKILVSIDNTNQTDRYGTIHVYDVPKFSTFDIPMVAVSKAGNIVSAIIQGKNFETPVIDYSNFTAICSTKSSIVSSSSFSKINDTSITASFIIPDTVGEYDITVKYGANSITTKLKVQDFSDWNIGDVLLNDGSIIHNNGSTLSFTYEQKEKAVGIMYDFNEYGIPRGWLGIYNSADGTELGRYNWARSGTIGYESFFEDIICTPSVTGVEAISKATFSGDIDGQDNWDYICKLDPVGTYSAEINYPAFDYVNNYAKKYGLTGNYSKSWYLPSLAELCYIYRNMNAINNVIEAVDGTLLNLMEYYWSSSQNYYNKELSWKLYFGEDYIYGDDDAGRIYNNYKSFDACVCCIRPFE